MAEVIKLENPVAKDLRRIKDVPVREVEPPVMSTSTCPRKQEHRNIGHNLVEILSAQVEISDTSWLRNTLT